MRALVRQAMEDGALGVGSSLIYAPAFYADTDELIALARSRPSTTACTSCHMRSEGDRLLEGVEEVIEIAARSGVRRRDLPPQGRRRDQLAKMDEVDRRGRGGPRRGAGHHRRHVHLHRRRDRPRRRHAAVGAGGRARRVGRPPPRSGDPRSRRRRDAHADRRLGEPVPRRRLAPTSSCSSASRTTRSSR